MKLIYRINKIYCQSDKNKKEVAEANVNYKTVIKEMENQAMQGKNTFEIDKKLINQVLKRKLQLEGFEFTEPWYPYGSLGIEPYYIIFYKL